MDQLKCTICENSNVILQDQKMDLYYCNNCDHCFTNAEEDLNLYHEMYFSEERQNWFIHPDLDLYETVYQNLISLVPPPMAILDIGCGNGNFLKFLKKKEKPMELHGIDLSENTYPGIKFIKADYNSFNIKDKFDVITNFMVIEHIKDVHAFMKKIISNSNDRSSWLIINTINNHSIIYVLARLLSKFGFRVAHDRLYSKHHLNHFSNKSLKTLVEKNGYEVIKHWNHNYTMKKVDVPKGSFLMQKLYKFGVFVMFRISDVIGNGHSQTLIANKEWRK